MLASSHDSRSWHFKKNTIYWETDGKVARVGITEQEEKQRAGARLLRKAVEHRNEE